MAEQTSSRTKRPRVGITFLPSPVAARPRDRDDPFSDPRTKNPTASWILELIEGEGHRLGAWGVWLFSDLEITDGDRAVQIDEGTGEYLAHLKDMTKLVVPDLPEEHLNRLTYRQLLAIKAKMNEEPGETREEAKERKADAANPPDGERGSGTTSRSPHDSMAGATAT